MTTEVFKYQVGDTGLAGDVIDGIYGHSPSVIVYRSTTGRIRWQVAGDVLTPAGLTTQQRYEKLRARLESSIPLKKQKQFEDALARSLFLGLCETAPEAALAHFDHVEGELLQVLEDEGRLRYAIYSSIVAVFVVAVSLVALILTADPKYGLFSVAGGAGAAGAWASVLQRASRLKLGAFDNPESLVFQGVSRVVLGTVFGVVGLLAMKAGIILSAGASSFSAVAIVTFLAGFSERFVPELLNAMERSTLKTKE